MARNCRASATSADVATLDGVASGCHSHTKSSSSPFSKRANALGFVRADQFPNLDAGASAGRGNTATGIGVPGNINDIYVLAANVSFEVDLWGKLRRSTEAARAELLATVEARNVVTITLIADVASVYLLLLDLDKRVTIAQRTMETRQDSLGIVQARFDKGVVPLIDVNQAEIELAEVRQAMSLIKALPYSGRDAAATLSLSKDDVADLEYASAWCAHAVLSMRTGDNNV